VSKKKYFAGDDRDIESSGYSVFESTGVYTFKAIHEGISCYATAQAIADLMNIIDAMKKGKKS
jgi:hypothetical protein